MHKEPVLVCSALARRDDATCTATGQFRSLTDTRRILFSCGGGMPPNAPTENVRAFMSKVRELSGR